MLSRSAELKTEEEDRKMRALSRARERREQGERKERGGQRGVRAIQ
jgi:hypothetical protein